MTTPMTPILAAPVPPPELTDETRRAVLLEARAHCAPSTWDTFTRSLRYRQYPLDTTTLGD